MPRSTSHITSSDCATDLVTAGGSVVTFTTVDQIVAYCERVFPQGLAVRTLLRRLAEAEHPNLMKIDKHIFYTVPTTVGEATRSAWSDCTWAKPKVTYKSIREIPHKASVPRIVDNTHLTLAGLL